MMDQYRRIRRELPENTILFFRLGDFYEMFMEDANEAARILDITLTKRQDIPMCGVPYHAAEGYLAQLIAAGKKVAICEQVEDPAAAKGIVKREITRVVTPGTVLDETSLDRTKNNYLASLVRENGRFGLAMLDLSTGAFWIEESTSAGALSGNLARYAPQECIVAESAANDTEILAVMGRTLKTIGEDWTFESASAEDVLLRHFKVHSLKGFGCENSPLGLRAAGAVLYYVNTGLRRNLAHVRRIQVKNPDDYLLLDETTIMNLELIAPLNPARQGPKSTLLSVLDTTVQRWARGCCATGLSARCATFLLSMRGSTPLKHLRQTAHCWPKCANCSAGCAIWNGLCRGSVPAAATRATCVLSVNRSINSRSSKNC